MSSSLKNVMQKAQAYIAQGEVGQAIALYTAWCRDHENDAFGHHNLAAALGDAGRQAEAVHHADKAIALGLDKPEPWLVRARALQALCRLDEAEQAFEHALTLRSDDATVLRDLVQMRWMRTGERNVALRVLDDAIAGNPQNLGLQFLRAQLMNSMGAKEQAYEAAKHLYETTGRVAALRPHLAHLAISAGYYDDALGLTNDPAAADEATSEARARALLGLGNVAAAEAVIAVLRADHPANQYYRALEATAWRMAGKTAEYRQTYDYERFVRAAPLARPAGWSSLEAYLEELKKSLDRLHPYTAHPFGLSVRNGSQLASIECLDDPALKAYPEAVAGPFEAYREHILSQPADDLPPDHPMRDMVKNRADLIAAWSIRLPAKGFHVNHVHPAGWLSSACHLRPVVADPADEQAGWLKFGEPGIATEPPLEPEHFHEPQAGLMVIFPSYVWHGTVPFGTGGTRLTIAADFKRAPMEK